MSQPSPPKPWDLQKKEIVAATSAVKSNDAVTNYDCLAANPSNSLSTTIPINRNLNPNSNTTTPSLNRPAIARLHPWDRVGGESSCSYPYEGNDLDSNRLMRSPNLWDRRPPYHSEYEYPYNASCASRHLTPPPPYGNNYLHNPSPATYGPEYPYHQSGIRPLNWPGMAVDKGYQWVNGFHTVTAGFGRLAGLLDANSQAMHSALSSLIYLVENAGYLYKELGVLLSSVTAFRTIKRMSTFIALIRHVQQESNPDSKSSQLSSNDISDYKQFLEADAIPPRHKIWSSFMLFATIIFFSFPYLCNIVRNTISRLGIIPFNHANKIDAKKDTVMIESTLPIIGQVRAIYDFEKERDEELNIHTGDVIHVLEKPFQNWWKGQIQGKPDTGLFPTNCTLPLT